MHFWTTIVGSLGLPALISAGIGWYYQDKLKKLSFEHQIRFSTLHERQAKVIAETYSTLVATIEGLMGYIAVTNSEKEAIEDRRAIARDKYFVFHTIYAQTGYFTREH